MTGYVKNDQHVTFSTLLERMAYMEKMVGESADHHSNHKASMETRLGFVEKTLGDNAEKHTKELAAHAEKHAKSLSDHAERHAKDLAAVAGQKADTAQHSTLLQRVDYLEKSLGESADSHSNHKTTMEKRLEFIEKMIG